MHALLMGNLYLQTNRRLHLTIVTEFLKFRSAAVMKRSRLILKLVFLCTFIAVLAWGGAGYYAYLEAVNFGRTQLYERFNAAQASLGHLIKKAQTDLSKHYYALYQDHSLVDYTDYGQGSVIDVYMADALRTEPGLEYQIFDYAGDALTHGEFARGIDPVFIKQIVKDGLAGQKRDDIVYVKGALYAVTAGPMGILSEASGVLILFREFSHNLIDEVFKATQVHLGFVYNASEVSANGLENTLSAFLAIVPRSATVLIGNQFERFMGSTQFRLLADNDHRVVDNLRWIFSTTNEAYAALLLRLGLTLLLCFLTAVLLTSLLIFLETRRVLNPLRTLGENLLKIGQNILSTAHLDIAKSEPAKSLVPAIQSIIDQYQTALANLNRDWSKEKERLALIYTMIEVDDTGFKFFLDNFKLQNKACLEKIQAIKENPALWRQGSSILLRAVHSIKDDALFFGLEAIAIRVKTFEETVIGLRKEKDELLLDDWDTISNGYNKVLEEISNYSNLRRQVLKRDVNKVIVTEVTNTQVLWLKSLLGKLLSAFSDPFVDPTSTDNLYTELDRAISSVGRIDIRDYLKRYDKMLTKLAEKTPKKIKPIQFSSQSPFFSPLAMPHVNDMLVKCLKNVIDHGIENLPKRVKLGKEPPGELAIKVDRRGNNIEIVIQDDGQGVEASAILDAAVRKNLVSADEAKSLSEAQVMDLVFKEGVSTSTKVSLYEGRGLGLTSVREKAASLGGRTQFISSAGKGSAIKIILPDEHRIFLSKQTCFALGAQITALMAEFTQIYEHAGVHLVAEEPFAQEYVCADRQVFVLACRKIFEMLAGIIESGHNLRVGLQRLNLSHDEDPILSVAFNFGKDALTLLPALMEEENFNHLSEMLAAEEGLNLRLDPMAGSLQIDVVMNLPAAFVTKNYAIMLACNEKSDQIANIQSYMERVLTNWPYQIYPIEHLDLFIQACKTGIGLVFVEDGFLGKKSKIHEFLSEREIPTVLLSSDVSAMDPVIAGSFASEPLVLELPLDSFAICKALETAMTRYVFSL